MEKLSKTERIDHFEELVDELMKKEPNEVQIKFLMEKLDLDYERDPIHRISFVLEKMNTLVFTTNNKKGENDL